MKTYHVYAIVRRTSGDAYVGCTSRIETRWTEHKRLLSLANHSSPRLQTAWIEFGETAFEFVILDVLLRCAYATAKRVELHWIKRIGSYNEVMADTERQKYVLPEHARLALGERNRARAKTPEQRQNMSRHMKERWADPQQRAALMRGPLRGNGFVKGMESVKSPEQWAEHSQHMKDVWADPERRQKLEARRAARWSDPEAKARQAEKMRAYHAARRSAGTPQHRN